MAIEATTIGRGRGRRRRGRLGRLYYGWWVLFGMVVAMIVAEGVTFGSFGAYVVPLEEAFGWSRAQVSLGFSVTVGVVGASAPLIGRLIDVVGPRRLMLIGAPLCCVSFVLLAFMTELWQWYAYMGLSAISLGCIAYIPAQALAVRWFDDHRAVATSLIGASVWMGQLVMLPLVQLLISRLGWEDAFIYSGIMIVGAYAVAFLLVRDQPPPGGERAHAHPAAVEADAALSSPPEVSLAGLTAREAVRTKLFWLLVFGLMAIFFVVFGWLSQAHPYYQSVGYSDSTAALIVSITAGGAVIWLLAAGSQLERIRRPERIAAVGSLFVAGSMITLYLIGGSDGGTALHVVLYVLGFATVPPLEALMISRAFGLSNFATILGTGFMFETIAIFFSPIVAGSIFDNTGSYDDALLLYGICALASVVIFIAASRVQQPMQARLPSLSAAE
ncbi:MAG: MFS transporter [Chloroflexi bacterium]|nr:MFS transporter [Chloroflexota bacterium]MCY3571411.1 MFS transporter [Chloroflexota bacterium]MCY3686250.1 MFS transporter [Chloroflexota bacterium]MCY3696120.1 MFS transporter [Chloroflexota bacterium]